MKLSTIIANVDEKRPNQFSKEMMTGWINEIESKACRQVIGRAFWGKDDFEPYDYERDSEAELRIPDEHCDVYETYLFAKMDYTNGEIERYNADAAMHQAAWTEYAAEYRRSHYPRPIV